MSSARSSASSNSRQRDRVALRGRVLIIAGSDSGGGAGIQADIKTVTALGGYAMTAVTALTAQNTLGVEAVHAVPADFVRKQIDVVLSDLGADAIKTGMLGTADIVLTVAEALDALEVPVVVDPVMVAKGGHKLLDDAALDAVKGELIPAADLVTPNIPEAALLAGMEITDRAGQIRAAEALLALGPGAVLLKGAHLPGEEIGDLLMTAESAHLMTAPRIESRHTHGTGCTLASAIATFLAQGAALTEAVEAARDYVQAAIASAPGFGKGHGPLNHVPFDEIEDG